MHLGPLGLVSRDAIQRQGVELLVTALTALTAVAVALAPVAWGMGRR